MVSGPRLSELQTALCIVFVLAAPLASAGLALTNAGLGRSRNAAHAMMAALCVTGVAVIAYFILGSAIQGYSGEPGAALRIAGTPWNWIGTRPLFLRAVPLTGSVAFLAAWFGTVGAAVTGLIPLGSGAERWRLSAICASTALLTGVTFPLFSHWTWGGGWLAQLGTNYGLGGGYLDAGGGGPIHSVGGLTALAAAWMLGPRRGKYTMDGIPTAIPGHNAVLVLFGCLVALVGWVAIGAAGAMLFAGAEPERVPLIALNTLLSASSGALAAAMITRIRFGKPDASLTVNGWSGGIAAGSAVCAFVPPAAAMIVGLVSGVLVTYGVELLEFRLDVDDPGGSISVHAVGGMWGVLAVGLFGRREASGSGQLLAQAIGIATLLGFVLPLTYSLNRLIGLALRHRVDAEGEHQGMDLHELGAGAYPEFMTHTDEFLR